MHALEKKLKDELTDLFFDALDDDLSSAGFGGRDVAVAWNAARHEHDANAAVAADDDDNNFDDDDDSDAAELSSLSTLRPDGRVVATI